MPTAARKPRAVLAFSATKSRSERMIPSTGSGSASAGAPPSGVGIAYSVEPHQPSTGMPACASIVLRAISGNPMSEVGSSVSIRSMRTMPKPSDFALPAQS